MDTLTHALSGALLARATAPKTPHADQLPIGLRSWIGFLAAAFPDSDFVIRFFDSFTYLTQHRGVTHSLILLPVWALVLSWVLTKITRGRYSWKAFFGVCLLGILAHIVGDVITAFGTMVLAPFSDWRAQFATTFIIDLYFSGIILLALLVSLFAPDPRKPAVWGLAVLAAYIGLQATQHFRAVGVGQRYASEHDISAREVHALPQPLSPFNWLIVVGENAGYRVAYVNLLRHQTPATPPADASWFARVSASYRPVDDAGWKHVERFGADSRQQARKAWDSPALADYRHFVMLPAVLRTEQRDVGECVWFQDLRFVMTGRDKGPFRYGACQGEKDGPWALYRLDTNDDGSEAVRKVRG